MLGIMTSRLVGLSRRILYSRIGEGHRDGTGIPGKTEFPSGWTGDKILHEISDVAMDPNSISEMIEPNGYQPIISIQDGINLRVIYDTMNDRIVADYPTNVTVNP